MIPALKTRRVLAVLLCLALGHGGQCPAEDGEFASMAAQFRRPVALVAIGDRLLVGNQRSGTISVIDLTLQRAIAEHSIPARVAHLAAHPGQPDLFVLDNREHRLLAVTLREDGIDVEPLAEVAPDPIRMAVANERSRVYITSRWSRRLTVVTFDEAFQKVLHVEQVDVPFPPQELLVIDEGRHLLIAAAFGGGLAVVGVESLAIERTCTLPGHNVRGLAASASGAQVSVSQQKLNPLARTEFDDVHWGMLITNAVRVLAIDALLDAETEATTGGWLERLGGVGNAAGDPGPVLIDEQGRLIVALSGVDEVAITQASYAGRIAVGRRPVALAVTDDQHLAVANHLDDSISLINLEAGQLAGTISLGPHPEPSSRDRGESLFYNARLSHDGWMSCHSCHSEGHTAELLVDTLGDGDYGAPKRIPSLLGTGAAAPWAWNGTMATLEEQVLQSVRSTMHGADVNDQQVGDLVAFLQTLPAPPPRAIPNAGLVERGAAVFEKQGCIRCHQRPAFTTDGTYDVGLVDESGRARFNPPSLLGVGQRDRFFHDGRTLRLEDVVGKLRHQLAEPLPEEEATVLLEFLRSL